MKRALVLYPDARLRKRCAPVEEITPEIRLIAQDMIDTMCFEGRGIGLGACQIGEMLRIIVVGEPEPVVYINPKLSDPSAEKEGLQEATLSLPGVSAWVERPVSITIEALDLEGNSISRRLSGLEARIAMHENDHINGVLFIDRVSRKERRRLEPLLRKVRRGAV